jgi:hypothetical protein
MRDHLHFPDSAGIIYLVIFLFSSCAVKVSTVYDHTASFEDYRTFCWFENCEFTIDGPVYLKRDSASVEAFKQAIVEELERKGYVYDQDNPDFLLHMHVVVEEQQGVLASPYNSGDGTGWQGAFPFEAWEPQSYVYLKGSLIIDIADANDGKMVWRSDAVEYLDITSDISNSRLKRGIKKVLKDFPPGS